MSIRRACAAVHAPVAATPGRPSAKMELNVGSRFKMRLGAMLAVGARDAARHAAPAADRRPAPVRGLSVSVTGGEPPQRVRVTSSRRSAAPMHARPVTRDLDEQTGLGDVYLAGLMRAQLRLSLAVLGLTIGGLAALPVVLTLVPATRTC